MTPVPGSGWITVITPATSANLGPGFDALGLALQLYDEVHARLDPQGGLRVQVEGEGAAEVSRDATHLVVRAMHATFQRLDQAPPGLELRCVNRIPHGRGLGSSAAAIVGGVLAARALACAGPRFGGSGGSGDFDEMDVLGLASELEGHPDNVAACLLGGATVAWTSAGVARAVRLDPHPDLATVALVPGTALATSTARGLLPASVSHRDAAHSAGRAALLVAALTSRPDILLAATEDRLHQAYRAAAMPATLAMVGRLREAGVAAVVSGAGPTVLALVIDDATAEVVRVIAGAAWWVLDLGVDRAGAQVRGSVDALTHGAEVTGGGDRRR